MSASLSTHVLDQVLGRPAARLRVTLSIVEPHGTRLISTGTTNDDGRVPRLAENLAPGTYVINFDTGHYWEQHATRGFYPWVDITFRLFDDGAGHYHVPLLLSPFGYATYRGS